MPDEAVKAVSLQLMIGLDRDEHAEAMAELEDGGETDVSADRGQN